MPASTAPPSIVIVEIHADGIETLDQPEVDDFRHVRLTAPHRQNDVGRLDVAMDDPKAVRFRERAADLSQDVNDAPRRQSAVASNQLLEIDAVEELHRVVEDAVRCPSIVVNRYGIRVREHRA